MFKFLPCTTASQLARQTNTTHYIDPYDTQMDQKLFAIFYNIYVWYKLKQ